ncbi:MAG: hypothetical protein PV354_09035, partial [Bartonella sp.]|nr:hypothetical protein [Bartonella sp.]
MRYKLVSIMLVIDLSIVQAVSSNTNIDIEGKPPVSVTSSNDLRTFPYGQGYSQGYIREEQNVSGGDVVWNAKVMEGGIQSLYATNDQEEDGGTAVNTTIFRDGRQRVSAEGVAITVTLYDNAVQEIYKGGYVYDLTVHDRASSWAYAGATLEGNTIINDFGKFLLYAGDKEHQSTVENFILNGKDTKLYSIAADVDGESSLVESLSGNGSVIFTSTVSNPHYSKLEIN